MNLLGLVGVVLGLVGGRVAPTPIPHPPAIRRGVTPIPRPSRVVGECGRWWWGVYVHLRAFLMKQFFASARYALISFHSGSAQSKWH